MRNLYGHHFELKPGTWVYVPTLHGRTLGEVIHGVVKAKWKAPANYFHLKAGGHVAAVRLHASSPVVASLDLTRFFDQISRSRVLRTLKKIGFSYAEAWEYACDSTVQKKNGTSGFSIPFGFVQSPMLASICLRHSALGRAVSVLSRRLNVSVYVDDITVSGETVEKVADAIRELEQAAARSGFMFNPAKTQPPSDRIVGFNIRFGSGDMSIVPDRMEILAEKFQNGNEFERMGIASYVWTVNQSQLDELEP